MSTCRELREQLNARIDLLAFRASGRPPSGESLTEGTGEGIEDSLSLHLKECSACRLRSERLVSALAGLAVREPAPAELDGRVVAVMGGGYRQDRGVKALLRFLSRKPAPGGLGGWVEERLQGSSEDLRPTLARALRTRVRAPGVLERLVAEEIRDPAGSTARRFVGTLGHARAPEELERGLVLRSPRRMRVSLAVAAALLAVLLLTRPESPPSYSFRVVRVSSPSELSPMARSLLDAATAGALSSGVQLEKPERAR